MNPLRSCALVAALAAFALAGCDAAGDTSLAGAAPPEVAASTTAAGSAVPDQYIVLFNRGTADAPGLANRLARAEGVRTLYVYEHAVQGFAFRGSAQAAAALARNPNVALVERDQVVQAITTQSNATWGLDRSDQRDLPLSTSYTYETTADNVTAYIIDTGIRYDHVDFGGRAVFGYDAFGGNGGDGNGHGTHVAGTVGGSTWGIAKGVALVAIRVLDNRGSGTTSGVIAGVDWVTANARKPAVANMSLGGGASSTLDAAVRNSVAAGITYAVAAGNDSKDACNYSPARVAEALTVGSTTSSDARSTFSNFGTCVNLFAPGSSITSAWHTSSSATNTISGTSMASPHVAGAAALYLAANTGASPATVGSAITTNATPDKVTSAGTGSPNLLLYTLSGSGGGGGGGGGTTPDPGDVISLMATGFKSGGRNIIDLSWTGSTATSIDVFRNGTQIATVSNSGAYRDDTRQRGGATYTHKVCNAGTTTCSNQTTTTF